MNYIHSANKNGHPCQVIIEHSLSVIGTCSGLKAVAGRFPGELGVHCGNTDNKAGGCGRSDRSRFLDWWGPSVDRGLWSDLLHSRNASKPMCQGKVCRNPRDRACRTCIRRRPDSRRSSPGGHCSAGIFLRHPDWTQAPGLWLQAIYRYACGLPRRGNTTFYRLFLNCLWAQRYVKRSNWILAIPIYAAGSTHEQWSIGRGIPLWRGNARPPCTETSNPNLETALGTSLFNWVWLIPCQRWCYNLSQK